MIFITAHNKVDFVYAVCLVIKWGLNSVEVVRIAFEDARKEETQCAAEAIKLLRVESKAEWNGAKEIRRWRDAAK